MSHYIEIRAGWACRVACLMIGALLMELPAVDASAQRAEAPASLCFDIITARNTAEPGGAILLNRCTGQTWLLTRYARRSYRWNLLVAEGNEHTKPLPRPEVQMPALARPSTGKCFTFQGRQFCD